MINIVLNHTSLAHFKTSQYFKVNLGLVATVEKNGNRVYNDKDKFSKFYTSTYNSIIYGQGNIGDIKIYNDPYIQGDVFAVYTADFQEFIFNLDRPMIKDKGIDFYIGFILKSTEEQYDERVRLEELKKVKGPLAPYKKAITKTLKQATILVTKLEEVKGENVFLETEFNANRQLLVIPKNPRSKGA